MCCFLILSILFCSIKEQQKMLVMTHKLISWPINRLQLKVRKNTDPIPPLIRQIGLQRLGRRKWLAQGPIVWTWLFCANVSSCWTRQRRAGQLLTALEDTGLLPYRVAEERCNGWPGPQQLLSCCHESTAQSVLLWSAERQPRSCTQCPPISGDGTVSLGGFPSAFS